MMKKHFPALPPRHLQRVSAGENVGPVLRVAEDHRKGTYPSHRHPEFFPERCIGEGGHGNEARPAGADTERLRCYFEMAEGDDPIHGGNRACLRDMGHQQVRGVAADGVMALLPGMDQSRYIPGHGMVGTEERLHPSDGQSGNLPDIFGE